MTALKHQQSLQLITVQLSAKANHQSSLYYAVMLTDVMSDHSPTILSNSQVLIYLVTHATC